MRTICYAGCAARVCVDSGRIVTWSAATFLGAGASGKVAGVCDLAVTAPGDAFNRIFTCHYAEGTGTVLRFGWVHGWGLLRRRAMRQTLALTAAGASVVLGTGIGIAVFAAPGSHAAVMSSAKPAQHKAVKAVKAH